MKAHHKDSKETLTGVPHFTNGLSPTKNFELGCTVNMTFSCGGTPYLKIPFGKASGKPHNVVNLISFTLEFLPPEVVVDFKRRKSFASLQQEGVISKKCADRKPQNCLRLATAYRRDYDGKIVNAYAFTTRNLVFII